MHRISGIVLLLISCTTFAQESILKDFAEDRRDFKLCFYPSTLRMINIKKDPEFNEMVSGVEKLLIYSLDSATSASKNHSDWINKYLARGYEEYVSMSGKVNLLIIGNDDEFVGSTTNNGKRMVFYLRGKIAFQKIPKLVRTFEGGDVLSLITDQLNN